MQFEWTVFFGDAGDAEARVYILATPMSNADAAQLEGLTIAGRVDGPKCRYSHTLPARIPVRFRGVKTTHGRAELIGEAIVPDPNMWTPELPFLYRATVEVRRGAEVLATYEQDFGIRPLGVIGRRLVYCGKTWVPRAVRRSVVVGEAPLEHWRETATVMVVDDPDEDLCREASEVGVLLFATLGVSSIPLRDRIRRLRRYAAVAMVIVEAFGPSEADFTPDDARNVVLAQAIDVEPGVHMIWPEARCLVIDCGRRGEENAATGVANEAIPCLVQRNTDLGTLMELRAACDRLQADLAGKCDPAGYIV